jgi:glycosyltransferase involved in cell wall biosynthesis
MHNGARTDERVAILLATYNGEKYLDELIRSLLSQTYRNFVVMARDDQSNDQTPNILERWAAAHPDKVIVLSDEHGNLGSLRSFSLLMESCDAPYFALCDQDDVWLPNKVELSINEVRNLEDQSGEDTPILVHSDLKVVDANLREVSRSFFEYSGINTASAGRLDQLIINNIVAGCSSMGNRVLLELARPIPDGLPYHDWWLALVATSCGVLRTMVEPTILYRQHGENQVGAPHQQRGNVLWEARHVFLRPKLLKARIAKAMLIVQSQANMLLRVAGERMPRRNREFLQAFCLPQRRSEAALLPWPRRAWLFIRFLTIYVRELPLALRWCY